MADWNHVLQERHLRYHAKDGSTLVLASPLASSERDTLVQASGFPWTEEFFDLYGRHNGVGLSFPGEEVLWEFVPAAHLATFGESVCDWFAATHPEVAKEYHPFYDWGSGDAIGYLNLKELEPGTLVEFEHEYYEFDASQPWGDFLKPVFPSIQAFLEV